MEQNWGQVLLMHKKTWLESLLCLFFLVFFCPSSHFPPLAVWVVLIWKAIYGHLEQGPRKKVKAVIATFLFSLLNCFFDTLFCRVQVFSKATKKWFWSFHLQNNLCNQKSILMQWANQTVPAHKYLQHYVLSRCWFTFIWKNGLSAELWIHLCMW